MKLPRKEFDRLVSGVCDGTADKAQLRQLSDLLRSDKDARDQYLISVDLHAILASDPTLFAEVRPPEPIVREAIVSRLDAMRRRSFPIRTPSTVALTVCVVAIVAVVLVLRFSLHEAPRNGSGVIVRDNDRTSEERLPQPPVSQTDRKSPLTRRLAGGLQGPKRSRSLLPRRRDGAVSLATLPRRQTHFAMAGGSAVASLLPPYRRVVRESSGRPLLPVRRFKPGPQPYRHLPTRWEFDDSGARRRLKSAEIVQMLRKEQEQGKQPVQYSSSAARSTWLCTPSWEEEVRSKLTLEMQVFSWKRRQTHAM